MQFDQSKCFNVCLIRHYVYFKYGYANLIDARCITIPDSVSILNPD